MVDRQTVVFRSVLDAAFSSGLHRLLAFWTQGAGVAFTLHNINPNPKKAFDPNYLLDVSPEFLEKTVVAVLERGFDCVTLDEAVRRLCTGDKRKFVAFTFDDGYRSVRDLALPILRRYNVPSTLFITTSFADGTGDLWWLRLEHIIRSVVQFDMSLEGAQHRISTATDIQKKQAWDRLYWHFRSMDEPAMRAAITRIAQDNNVVMPEFARDLCMDWDELREVIRDPLVSIGAHTLNHYMLAKWPRAIVEHELKGSVERLEHELGVRVKHLAYPVGDATSAGPREFSLTADLGFTSAWTTRPGHLFAQHSQHITALPRLSLNGLYQERRYLDLFLSGLPLMLWNKFRKVNVD
jgi:peptidoglycan/xylan/chitin deacetylase (PgdA/CDA1 family)